MRVCTVVWGIWGVYYFAFVLKANLIIIINYLCNGQHFFRYGNSLGTFGNAPVAPRAFIRLAQILNGTSVFGTECHSRFCVLPIVIFCSSNRVRRHGFRSAFCDDRMIVDESKNLWNIEPERAWHTTQTMDAWDSVAAKEILFLIVRFFVCSMLIVIFGGNAAL